MTTVLAGLEPIPLEGGGTLPVHLAFRRIGYGPTRVLLLHALTGGPWPEGEEGYWAPLFEPDAPFDPRATTVWAPNLPGSCYGSVGPGDLQPFPTLTPRDQARALARWIEDEDLAFELLLGGSLGGMVALELALLLPGRFKRVGVIGCGARSDAWIWGSHEVQRAILRSDLPDAEAIGLARRAAMLTFRAPAGLNTRFPTACGIQNWLEHHGKALAARFSRAAYLGLLDAMDAHDIGRGRGGVIEALRGLQVPLHILGLTSDTLFTPPRVLELAHAAEAAGNPGNLRWITSPHGHDAFLIEWAQVVTWVAALLPEPP